jgi:predicted transcriptional regulator
MKNRSRTEIISLILEAAKEGASRTKILYKAMLSYTQARDYLTALLDAGLVEKVDNTFKTTEKGIQFLQINEPLQKMLESRFSTSV